MSIQKKANIIVLGFLFVFIFFSIPILFSSVRYNIIKITETFVMHRLLNHEKWDGLLFNTAVYSVLVFFPLLILKLFSLYFSLKVQNSFINFVRCLACLMVYILHTSIFTNSRGVPLFTSFYSKLLQTPAWGGVWIFFILGGFLAGKSFAEGRYEFDMKSICQYYKKKFVKIIIPTFSFIFLCCVFVYPLFLKNNPVALFRFLTFSYNGSPGVDGIGACWYVFTLVPLYLLTPLFCFIAQKLVENKRFVICITLIVFLLGFCYRYFARKFGLDWYTIMYTPFYANIDLFFGGILIARLAELELKNKNCSFIKDFSLFALLAIVLLNTVFYGDMFFYQVVCPSLYLVILAVCLIAFSDEIWTHTYSNIFEKTLAWFSGISFDFYLFHSLVLYTILPAFKDQNVFLLHGKLLVIGFIITTICSIGFSRIFVKGKKVK